METIKLAKPPHFKFSECLYFLDRGYDECLYRVKETSVQKAILLEGKKYLVEISEHGNNIQIELLKGKMTSEVVSSMKAFVAAWFDLSRDLKPFHDLIRQSPLQSVLGPFEGLRLVMIPNLFEAMCWSIIGQQINLTFAYSLKRRLVELCNERMTYQGDDFWIFPTPTQISRLTVDQLRERQFSQRKAEYLLGLATLFDQGTYSKEVLSKLHDTSEMVTELCKIRGIGEWSANYALMKSLGRMDCITHGDTGLQAAVRKVMDLDRKPRREEVIEFLKPYAGWESYLVFYLWRSLS